MPAETACGGGTPGACELWKPPNATPAVCGSAAIVPWRAGRRFPPPLCSPRNSQRPSMNSR